TSTVDNAALGFFPPAWGRTGVRPAAEPLALGLAAASHWPQRSQPLFHVSGAASCRDSKEGTAFGRGTTTSGLSSCCAGVPIASRRVSPDSDGMGSGAVTTGSNPCFCTVGEGSVCNAECCGDLG